MLETQLLQRICTSATLDLPDGSTRKGARQSDGARESFDDVCRRGEPGRCRRDMRHGWRRLERPSIGVDAFDEQIRESSRRAQLP